MANFLSLFKIMFLLVLCFMGNAEANICQAKSSTFTGSCDAAPKCTDACRSEGYQFGTCSDTKECYCMKPCPPN
ncbi:hypothetical protein P3S67_029964 [Capsicum chacoense]